MPITEDLSDVQIRDTQWGTIDVHSTHNMRILGILAHSPHPYIRATVAGVKSTPTSILLQLVSDPEVQVRAGVARSRTVPLALLEQLSSDASDFVQAAIVENPLSTEKLIRKAADFDSNIVKEALIRKPSVPLDVFYRAIYPLSDRKAWLMLPLWQHYGFGAMPTDVEDLLFNSRLTNVKISFLRRGYVSQERLDELSRCFDTLPKSLQRAVATNPRTKMEYLEAIAREPQDRSVITGLAENPSISDAIAFHLLSLYKSASFKNALAGASQSQAVLRYLWDNTTSESIRWTIDSNSFFHGARN